MTAAGYIDKLFCLPEAVGCGIAGRLYDTVEQIAKERGLRRLTRQFARAAVLREAGVARENARDARP